VNKTAAELQMPSQNASCFTLIHVQLL